MCNNMCPYWCAGTNPMCHYCTIYRNQSYDISEEDDELENYTMESTEENDFKDIDYHMEEDLMRHPHHPKTCFTTEEAIEIARELGIDFTKFDVEQFRMGLDVELEHGTRNPKTDVTGDDPILTGKIALAHLNEFSDYYTRLVKMEACISEEVLEHGK